MAAPATTSGTYSWVYTANKICTRALRQVEAFEAGETPDAGSMSDTMDALNAMVKEWQAMGLHVWTQAESLLFLQPGQYRYALGANAADHAVDWQSWFQTSLTATALTGATDLTVGSIANLAAAQFVGVVLDSGPIFWTTINGAPAGSTVDLTAVLPSQASVGASVYAFAPAPTGNSIVRPLRILGARRYQFATTGGSVIETPMVPMSRRTFMDLPEKSSSVGSPSQYFYEPTIGSGQQGPGYFYAWACPADATSGVRFTSARPIQDVADATEVLDLPVEWTNCIVRNLALEIAPEFGVTPVRYGILERRAQASMAVVIGWDVEPESSFFGCAFDPSAR